MRLLIPVVAITTAIAVITYDPTPSCDISIKPDSTWTWTGTPTTNCEFPTWATFNTDGTWETP